MMIFITTTAKLPKKWSNFFLKKRNLYISSAPEGFIFAHHGITNYSAKGVGEREKVCSVQYSNTYIAVL